MNQSEVIKSISQLMRTEIPEAETILYGSRARGSMRPDSDFDILVSHAMSNEMVLEYERTF